MDQFMVWFVGLFAGANGLDVLAVAILIALIAIVLSTPGGSRSTSRQPDRDQAHRA